MNSWPEEYEREALHQHMTASPDAAAEVSAGVPCRLLRQCEPHASHLHVPGVAMVHGSLEGCRP